MSSLIGRMRKRMRRAQGLGRRATFVSFDEASSLPTTGRAVDPRDIICSVCNAIPGERCTRWRRTKRGKRKQYRGSPHPDRKYDAGLASTALTALTINR